MRLCDGDPAFSYGGLYVSLKVLANRLQAQEHMALMLEMGDEPAEVTFSTTLFVLEAKHEGTINNANSKAELFGQLRVLTEQSSVPLDLFTG